MQSEDTERRVSDARFKILINNNEVGCGICVRGNFMITAAHCLEWTMAKGKMSQADFNDEFAVLVETYDSMRFHVSPVAVDPIADVAVLGKLELCALPSLDKDREQFDNFFGRVDLLDVSSAADLTSQPRILLADDSWIEGSIPQPNSEKSRVFISTARRLAPGDSGSPIVTGQGDLISIVSLTGRSAFSGKSRGCHPNLLKALPLWIIERLSL